MMIADKMWVVRIRIFLLWGLCISINTSYAIYIPFAGFSMRLMRSLLSDMMIDDVVIRRTKSEVRKVWISPSMTQETSPKKTCISDQQQGFVHSSLQSSKLHSDLTLFYQRPKNNGTDKESELRELQHQKHKKFCKCD